MPVLAAADLLLPAVAVPQEVPWPRCSERLDGQTLCGQGSVCECRYDGGGILPGRVAAWRWACDILKMCGEPAPAGPEPQPLPPGLTYSPGAQRFAPEPNSGVPPTQLRPRMQYRYDGYGGAAVPEH